MDSVWVKSPVESNSPMENVFKFDVKSEPEFDTMIENEVEPDSMTDSVLEAEFCVKSEPVSGIMIENEVEPDSMTDSVLEAEFCVKSEPVSGIMIENEVEPDSMTDSVLEAEFCVKSEPEAIIWMKSEPETDNFIKSEDIVDVHMEDKADQGTAFEFPGLKVEDSKVCTICSCV